MALTYVFDVAWVDGVPAVVLGNMTAYGTRHNQTATQRVNTTTDTAWLVDNFNRVAVGAQLVPTSERGAFRVSPLAIK